MPRTPRADLSASFIAYLHYAEDLAGVLGGRFGVAESLVEGVYEAIDGPGATPSLDAVAARAVNGHLQAAWRNLVRLEQLAEPSTYDRQVNAVVPRFAFAAVVAGVRALAAAEAVDLADEPGDALGYAAGRISEGLLPTPWSSRCLGCPQTGTDRCEQVRPGEVSVFVGPDPATSEARLALLLRTTRRRLLEEEFARARLQDVRPGRSRRNLSWQEKEAIAASTAPTTLLDVFARLHHRALEDDGDAFVDGAYDEVEAYRFAEAVRLVADATVAALEACVAPSLEWDLFADLVAGHVRRTPGGSATLRRRAAAAARLAESRANRRAAPDRP